MIISASILSIFFQKLRHWKFQVYTLRRKSFAVLLSDRKICCFTVVFQECLVGLLAEGLEGIFIAGIFGVGFMTEEGE